MSQAGRIGAGGGGGSSVVTLTGNSGGPVSPDSGGNINVVGAGGVTVTDNPGTHTLTITNSGANFTWNVVTSANNTQTLAALNGYIAKGASQCLFMLPASAAIGDTFIIAGYANLWQLQQNALQSVTLGGLTTTIGVTGSITATQVRDTIRIVCVTANT